MGIDYNIVEAIDQPWKIFEGSVGPYWGMFNDAREQKFAWSGPVTDPEHWKLAHSVGAARPPAVTAAPRHDRDDDAGHDSGDRRQCRRRLVHRSLCLLERPLLRARRCCRVGGWCRAARPAGVHRLARIEEIAAIAFGRKPRRLLQMASPSIAADALASGDAPKVSIHIPAYKEQPDMLNATLDAVAGLDYPNFECIVIINNTPDPVYWEPVEEHCRTLGERFKFLREDKVEGFKAGALRIALEHTAPDAEIIGILDADYIVAPGWLARSRAGLCRSEGWPRAGTAGASRRRPQRDALRDGRRIFRLLRYRHGGA